MKRRYRNKQHSKRRNWLWGLLAIVTLVVGFNYQSINSAFAETLSGGFSLRAANSTTLRIKVVDTANTTKPVSGAKFLVKSSNGGQWEVSSSRDGYAYVAGLTAGDYSITQISAPDGYLGIPNPVKVNIPAPGLFKYPEYADVTVSNTPYNPETVGTMTIKVVEDKNESVVIPYTTVRVTDDLGQIYVGTTDKSGQFTLKGLSKDRTYTLTLVEVPYQYDHKGVQLSPARLDPISLTQTQTIHLPKTQTTSVIINTFEKGDDTIKIPNAKYRLVFEDGTWQDITTDEKGTYKLDLPVSRTYILTQHTSDSTHNIQQESVTFFVKQAMDVRVPNELKDPKTAKVTVTIDKEWVDKPSGDQKATFRVYKNGQEYKAAGTKQLSSQKGAKQKISFEGLPKYDENHEGINWTIKEDAITDWYATYEEISANNWSVKNYEGALGGQCYAGGKTFMYVSATNSAYMLKNGTEVTRTVNFPNKLDGSAGTFGHAISYSRTSGYLYGIADNGEVAVMNPSAGSNGSLIKQIRLGGIVESVKRDSQVYNGRSFYTHPNFRKVNSGEMSTDGKYLFVKVLADPNIYMYRVSDIENPSVVTGGTVRPVKIIPSLHQADPSKWSVAGNWIPVSDGDFVLYENGDILYPGHETKFNGTALDSPVRDPLNYNFYMLRYTGPKKSDGTPDYENGSWSAPAKAGSLRAPAAVNISRDGNNFEYSIDGITRVFAGGQYRIFLTSEVWNGSQRTLQVSALTFNGQTAVPSPDYPDRVFEASNFAAGELNKSTYINKFPINTLDDLTSAASEVCDPEVTVRGRKHWIGDQPSDRPQSVVVELWEDGVPTSKTATVTSDNNWSYSFTGLPKEKVATNGQRTRIKYTVREKDVPAGYAASYDDGKSYDVTNTRVKGHFSFKKVELGSRKALEGAEFTLWSADQKTLIGKAVSGKDGTVTFKDLVAGTYILNEVKAPNDYTPTKDSYTVVGTVNRDSGQVTFAIQDVANNEITNNKPTYKLKIIKVDALTGEKITLTSRFAITDKSGRTISGQVVNLSNGEFTFTDPSVTRPGTYYLKEEKAPTGYTGLSGLIAFTIRADGSVVLPDGDNSMVSTYGLDVLGGDTIELRVKNISSELIVKKIDDSGQNVLVPVEFKLSKNGKVVETKTTDATTAQASFKLEANSTYTLEETKAADGYLKSTNVYTVKVSATGEVQVTLDGKTVPHTPLVVTNVKKHEFGIDKISIDKATLAGARLKLKAKDDTASQPEIKDGTTYSASSDTKDKSVTWTSSASGPARFMLTPGVYTVSEEKAPENYLPFTAFDVQVKKDGSLVILDGNSREQETNGFATVEKSNQVILRLINHAPKLRIKKVDFYSPEKMLAGATFKLYQSDNNTPVGNELTTSDSGVIEFPAVAPGTYYLEESKAPVGYQANSTRYKVIVAADYTVSVENKNDLIEAGQSQAEGVHTIMPLTVKNKPNIYKLKLLKRDYNDQDKGLEARFGLYDETGQKAIQQALVTSGDDNSVTVSNLAPGTYVLKEEQGPAGYQKLPADLKFTITEDGDLKVLSGNESYYVINPADSNLVIRLTIKNLKNGEFPKTGGLGTALFYGLGATLMLLAVLYRRMKRA
ncbi:SpaA isopeptide-forming pilin-related protein [Streptococcus ovuberis]|uniref:Cna B-type domain-containing protein n=1 Tax=Streptococcus ovuberis TaxID=1936207 RepID=A0A7X6MYB2_9STRE|nr:SpaA isopeptide-forming pilin-related protein [Streptococcus ovuberis]NKZ19949.1 Cna B-type domain-containing protein [Streptococcus ovuberis]